MPNHNSYAPAGRSPPHFNTMSNYYLQPRKGSIMSTRSNKSHSSASSADDIPPVPTPETSYLTLQSKPAARIAYTFYPASPSTATHPNPFSQTLVVFLNGLKTRRSTWDRCIHHFYEQRLALRLPYPAILTYDRFGQGDSDRDPVDVVKGEPPLHGHDCLDAVNDLHRFLQQLWREHLDITNPTHFPALIFVGNSIGCALARLYAHRYAGSVRALLFLDSIMANSDFVSLWPDPDSPDFDPNCVPPGATADDIRTARNHYKETFHPDTPNTEGLSRRNLHQLLPHADSPKLEGYGGEPPHLTVIEHDWNTFAEQALQGPWKTPKVLTMTYVNPPWRRYHEGLLKITDAEAVGVVPALRCGHFIQQDGPELVSDELVALLDRVVNRDEQVRERDGSVAEPMEATPGQRQMSVTSISGLSHLGRSAVDTGRIE